MSKAQHIINQMAADIQYMVDNNMNEKFIAIKIKQMNEVAEVFEDLSKKVDRAQKTASITRVNQYKKLVADNEVLSSVCRKLLITMIAFDIDPTPAIEYDESIVDELINQKKTTKTGNSLAFQRSKWSWAICAKISATTSFSNDDIKTNSNPNVQKFIRDRLTACLNYEKKRKEFSRKIVLKITQKYPQLTPIFNQ